jgi:DNA-binding transcriptional LysR family regulator
MEFRHLEYFLIICETGSLNAAAKKLFISQQALSKNLDSIEQEIGQPLFIRSPRGLRLTDAGTVLRSEAREIMRQHEHMMDRLSDLKRPEEYSLKISFYSGMLSQLESGFIQDFMQSHPNVRLQLFSYLDVSQTRDSANYDVDLFFSSNRLSKVRLDLLYEYHSPLCALMSEQHRLAARPVLHLDDLRGETIIILNADYDSKNLLELQLERHNVSVSSCLGDAEMDLIYWQVLNKNAISFFAGPEAHLPKGTVKRPIDDLLTPWNFYIYGKKSDLSPIAEEMIEEVKRVRENKDGL